MKTLHKVIRPWLWVAAILCANAAAVIAQINVPAAIDRESDAVRETRNSYLLAKARQDSVQYYADRERAIEVALATGQPIAGKTRRGDGFYLQGFDGSGQLRYAAEQNEISAATLQTNDLYPGGDAGLNLTGAGRRFGVWEINRPRATHVELNGRITQLDNSTQSLGDHATHVCGTMIAAGVNSAAKGMAYEASLDVYDVNNDLSEMTSWAVNGPAGAKVSSHSYGDYAGWEYGNWSGQDGWHWWGNASINQSTDYKFGLYDSNTRSIDNIVFNAPFYLPVRAAGNHRNDTGPAPGGQHWVHNTANQWVSSNAIRQPDGGSNGYDCVPTTSTAKNILSVGAVDAIPLGGGLFEKLEIASFSSWGPTDDGRIKPDIVARGVNVFSSTSGNNSAYDVMSGTSMAAPSVTGSLTLLLQHFTNLNPGFTIRASALRALVIHTADQLLEEGDGPNYRTGWGLMNTRAAADFITSNSESQRRNALVSRDTIFNNGTRQYNIYYDGSGDFKVTIAWTDPAGPVSSNTLNPTQSRLVNDLDLRVINTTDNTTYYPWQLNPAVPDAPAVKADNFRDNVEQVEGYDLPPGYYTIWISHKGTLTGAFQLFSMMISGLSQVPACAGNTTLTDCSGSITDGSGASDYGNNYDCSWTISPPGASAVTLNFTAFSTESGYDFVRVYNGGSNAGTLLGEFSGSSLPPTLTASSGQMYIEFETDGSATYAGWSANYSCSNAPPQLVVSPNDFYSGAGANTTSFNITASCAWSITNIPSWLSVTPTSGTGNATIQVSYLVNNAPQTRVASLLVTACNGLSASVSFTQYGCSVPTAPTITASGSTSLCPGQSVTLTATNPCSGCSMLWSNGQTGTSTTVSSMGTYTATYSNACGASPVSNSIGVTAGTLPVTPVISAGGSTSLCPGESVTLTATNPCSGCSVLWSNGQTGTSTTVSNAGTYTATFSNACGMSLASNSIGVTVGTLPATPVISASGSTSLCPGQSVTLTATNLCSGCSVLWSNGQTGTSTTVSNAGTYTATYSNACGASPVSNSIGVTAGTLPATPTISASGSTSLCPGQSVTLTVTNPCSGCSVLWSNGQTGTSTTVSNAGTYFATYSNNCGTSAASNVIAVNSNGAFTPMVQVNNLCYLAAPVGSGYQWSINGIAIAGASGQFWVAQANGYYSVSMLSPEGCPGTSNAIFAQACVSATNEAELLPLLRLYPNPAQDRVMLEVRTELVLPDVRLALFGSDGRYIGQVFQGDIASGGQTIEVNLPNLPSGLYLTQLITAKGSVYGSLMILR